MRIKSNIDNIENGLNNWYPRNILRHTNWLYHVDALYNHNMRKMQIIWEVTELFESHATQFIIINGALDVPHCYSAFLKVSCWRRNRLKENSVDRYMRFLWFVWTVTRWPRSIIWNCFRFSTLTRSSCSVVVYLL